MALQRKGENWDYGAVGVSADGIVEVTEYSARREYMTQVEARGSDGEVGAHLYGTEKITISVSGYAEEGNLPAIGGDITVKGLSGTIMSREITGKNNDFVLVKVEGIGYPAIDG